MRAYENSTTLRISRVRKTIAESIALDISNQCGVVVRASAVMNFVLDRYLNTEIIDEFITYYERKKEREEEKRLALLAANPPKKRGRPRKEDKKQD